MQIRIVLLVSISIVLNSLLYAGGDSLKIKNPNIIGVRSHYGFIIPHSKSIQDVAYSKPRGFQVDYATHLNTQAVWDYFGSYPRLGFTFSYIDYDNPEVLGNSYSLIAYFEPFITFRGRLNPSFRFGAGMSYLDNVYDPEINPYNLFYSSSFSFYLLANLGVNYRVNDRINLTLSGNYSHISNGRMKLPNKGINFPTVSLGVDYKLDPVILTDRVRQRTKKDIHGNLWKVNASFYTSRKEVEERGRKYQVYGLQVSGGLIVSRISAFNLGLDICHDRSLVEKTRREVVPESSYNPTSLSTFFKHELLMGRFTLDQTIGVYFNKPYQELQRFYQGLGMKYKLNPAMNMGVNLKTHTSTADFVSLRLGYEFK